jgi:hypothetical protein
MTQAPGHDAVSGGGANVHVSPLLWLFLLLQAPWWL